MSTSMRAAAVASQAEPIDRAERPRTSGLAGDDRARTTDVDLAELRTWITRAIGDTGWNQEALAKAMDKDAAYVSRVLSGDKPLSAAFIRQLPDDVEALVAKYHAESFGLVVVVPVSGDDAVRNLVSGLVGMLRPALPDRASGMAKGRLR